MANLDRVIDALVRQAMEEGKFDNLRGAGQPLKLNENAHVAPEWRLAYDLLQKENFALPWMETRQKIEQDHDDLVTGLGRSWQWRVRELEKGRDAGYVEAEWSRAAREFRARVTALNARIDVYNLEAPAEIFQRMRVNADKILADLKAD
jgi:hypothetical protein